MRLPAVLVPDEFLDITEGMEAPVGVSLGWSPVGSRDQLRELVSEGGEQSLEGVPHHQEGDGFLKTVICVVFWSEHPLNHGMNGHGGVDVDPSHSQEVGCPGTGAYLVVLTVRQAVAGVMSGQGSLYLRMRCQMT